MKIEIGQCAPDFSLPSHIGSQLTLSSLRGKNVVLAFFPLAWTPIWTNQIPSYEAETAEFEGLNAQVLGISVDHVPCLKAWAESLGGIKFPLLSDFWPHGAVSDLFGVLRASDGTSERALFILDRDGIVRYIDIHDIDDRPDNEELRRALREIEGLPSMDALPAPAQTQAVKKYADIVVYCARWCKDCRKVKTWLEERGLKYSEVDIDYDMEARKQVRDWANGRLVTPVITVGENVVLDFNVEQLEQALSRADL